MHDVMLVAQAVAPAQPAFDKTHLFTPLHALLVTAPTLALGVYYFVRSKRVGTFAMLTFLVSIVYGIGVELFDIRTTETYFYTDLLLMVGADPNWVPFSVGVSWACLLFVVMTNSDRLNLPVVLRPFFDGALALSIDFVMDPVASASVLVPEIGASCSDTAAKEFGGMGMWTWCVPEHSQAVWYTVPLANFIGWFLVVTCISAAVRIARGPLRAESRPWPVQLLMLSVLSAVAGFAVLCSAWLYPILLHSAPIQFAVMWTMYLAPIACVGIYAKRLTFNNPLDKGLLALPALILVSETTTFFVKKVDYSHWPFSAVVIVGAQLISAALLLLPYWRRSVSAAPTTAHSAG